ncbi:unnamed protein product [Sphagnum jensenii]
MQTIATPDSQILLRNFAIKLLGFRFARFPPDIGLNFEERKKNPFFFITISLFYFSTLYFLFSFFLFFKIKKMCFPIFPFVCFYFFHIFFSCSNFIYFHYFLFLCVFFFLLVF